MTNSDRKGKRGEREFAKRLRDMGYDARRGKQFSGGVESPDVVTCIKGVHFEVKRVERLSIDDALEQALVDGCDKVAVVAHRRNGKPWKLTLRLEDVEEFVKCWYVARAKRELEGGESR